ncbi:MAG: SusC/RagA family TonB-linked outer membrane protein [Puia sp.]|nr:SusC/RagA family TonB-linked outer membrane protein [Puia sp.]
MKLTAYLATIMTSFMILATCLSYGQERTLVGKVGSADGVPIQGVTVQEKGTHNTTITDGGGNYVLKLSNTDATIVFSFVGFTNQELPAGKESRINVILSPNNKQLEELVVTALGIKKETKRVGYSVQEIKGGELNKAREPDLFNSLEGKVSGLTIGTSPEMLGRPNVVLRGNKDVLIVVDGVPVNSDTWNVAADDVDNMSILKGPNAAALYGFRGLNGAIIITTKRGSKEAKGWQVNFNTSNMLEKGFTVIPKVQSQFGRGSGYGYSYDAGLLPGETAYDYGQRLSIWGPRMDGQNVSQYNSPYDPVTGVRTPSPYKSYGDKNLQHFLEAGFLSTNNISMASSGTNSNIRMSYSHVLQKGTGPNTKFNSDDLNLSADYAISPKLKFDANLNLNVQYTPNIPDADYGPNSYVYMFNVYGPASYDVKDLRNYYKTPLGVPGLQQYNENYGRTNNPYFMAHEWLRGHYKTDIYGYLRTTYNISKDLNVALRTQVTTWDQLRTEKVPSGTVLNQYLSWYYPGWYGDYREDHRNLMENNTDLLFSYKKKISDFSLNANLGGSWRSFKYASSFETTKDLAVPGVYSFSNSINPALSFNWGSNMQVYSGYYSVDLAYKNYVYLSTTGRVDNLSTLPAANNTFFYPSVSLATSIGDYVKLPVSIDLLKVRTSFADVRGGLTTSQAGSAYYQLTGNTLNGGLLGYGFENFTSYDGPTYSNQSAYSVTNYYNGQSSVSYSQNIADPSLKSFDIKSYEAGIDYSMFKGRIGLNATYFQSQNGPLIYSLPVASSTSYTSRNVNAVVTTKKGYEITLNLTPVRSKNFSWDITANYATFKEYLHSVDGGTNQLTLNNHVYNVGDRMDAWYSTKFVRDGSGNIVYNSGGNPLPVPSGINNLQKIGYLNPDFVFGFNNRFSYKSFSLSFQIDGRVGGKIYDDVWYHAMNGGTAVESDQGAFGVARNAEWGTTSVGTVTPTPLYVGKGVVVTSGTPVISGGKITNLKDLNFGPNTTATTVQSYLSSGLGSNFDEYYAISRTFVKLREVQIGYTLPHRLLGKGIFKTASVALIGRNLLYFAKRKDFDIDQYGSGFNVQDHSQTGTSSDVTLSSNTSRRFGLNVNLGF